MAERGEPMEIEGPKAPKRVPIKICPICRIKVLLEARQPLYTHTRLHIEDAWRQNENVYPCKGQMDKDGRRCNEVTEDKDSLTDHMLRRHSPVIMVPTTSQTYTRAVQGTTNITQRAKDRLAEANQADKLADTKN
jgi:hypothetical protein